MVQLNYKRGNKIKKLECIMRQTKLAKYLNAKKTVRMLINNTWDNGTLEFTFDHEHYNQLYFWMNDCDRNIQHYTITSESRRAILHTSA